MKGYTHISIILDRTGSMESIKDDTIGGFNTFLKEQQKLPGKATMTLVQFDSQDPYEVIHSFKAVKEIPDLNASTYVPRASTPLLDAIGRGINDLEKRLDDMKKKERPAKVVLVIITDGQENASCEFNKAQIEKMMKKKENDDWQFVFLSADLGSIGDATVYGFKADRVMSFDKNKKGSKHVWASVSMRLSEYRAGESESLMFSPADRDAQESEKKRK
ncbi:MAG: vWA domain-containing protein [Victivallales bacterium]|jgi:hypothetical protein